MNVICLKLKVLKEDALLAAGDPIFCQKCSAVFNMYSKLGNNKTDKDKLEEIREEFNEEEEEEKVAKDEYADGRIWIWEFWEHKNVIDVEDEEIPTKNAINYILETGETTSGKNKLESAIIFWIDISGSMWVTKSVEGKFKIKGDKYNELQALMKFSDGSDQFAFNDRNVTYVSRLQWVQAAIESQLIEMKTEKSKRKVGLVSFNGDVTIIGDGSQVPQVISGDKLKNYDYNYKIIIVLLYKNKYKR